MIWRLARDSLILAALVAFVHFLIRWTPGELSQPPASAPIAVTDSASIPAPASAPAALLAQASAAGAHADKPAKAASAPSESTPKDTTMASAASAPAASAASAETMVAKATSAAKAASVPAGGASSAAQAAAGAASSASATVLARQVPADPCTVMVKLLPNLSAELCEAAKLQLSGAQSAQGYPLYQRDVSAAFQQVTASLNGQLPPRRPRVLVIGAIHGDEISSSSLVFHWIAHAVETGADMDWRFIPALNPDGLLQKRPTRTNSRGVDLNRNFPTLHWDKEAFEYWTKRTKQDVRRYPGPEPLSEPESRFVTQTMERWKPDVIVSVHAPFGVLDYDGPSTPPERLGRLFLDRVGIYPGSLGNYGGLHRSIPVVTIELPNATRTPTEAEMRQMWIDLLRWIGERLPPVER